MDLMITPQSGENIFAFNDSVDARRIVSQMEIRESGPYRYIQMRSEQRAVTLEESGDAK